MNAFQHFTGSWLGAPIPNATVERARANDYPNVRLFTVGEGNQSATPFQDLQTVLQPWTVASNASLMGEGALPEERMPVSLTGFSLISKVLVPVWQMQTELIALSIAPDGVLLGCMLVLWAPDLRCTLSDTCCPRRPHGEEHMGRNTWGGTQIAQWMPSPAFARCNQSISSNGGLYNAMIHPYVVGPMAIAGFTWYQVSFSITFAYHD
eukprot:SAG31_NODE_114_length_24318_cov_16.787481_20_plen_208_part_00